MIRTFTTVNETLVCGHSNESYWAILYFEVLLFILSYCDVILTFKPEDETLGVWPFRWKLLSIYFTRSYLIWVKQEIRRIEVTAEMACCSRRLELTFFSASSRSLSSSCRWCAWTQMVSRLSAFILSITLCWSIPRFVSLNRESLRCCNSSAREECSFLQIKNIHNEWRMGLQKLWVSQNFRLNFAVSILFSQSCLTLEVLICLLLPGAKQMAACTSLQLLF